MTRDTGSGALIPLGIAATLAMLYYGRSVLIPFVIAFVLAMLVTAFVQSIVKRWPNAPRWAVCTIAGAVIAVAAASSVFVIIHGGVAVVHRGPALMMRVDQLIGQLGPMLGVHTPLSLATVVGRISIPKIAGGVLMSLQDLLSGLVLTIVYLAFMLAARAKLMARLDSIAASTQRAKTVRSAIDRMAADIQTYVWVQSVTGAMLAVASGVAMGAIGLDDPLFWTVALFLLSFIPVVGVTIGSIAPALFALLQFPGVWEAVAIFGAIQAIAFIVGNFIFPRLQADTQNIDPVVTIVVLSLWTFLWGVPGALLAVPLTLMLMMACAHFAGTRWIAVLLSYNGHPYLPEEPSPNSRRVA